MIMVPSRERRAPTNQPVPSPTRATAPRMTSGSAGTALAQTRPPAVRLSPLTVGQSSARLPADVAALISSTGSGSPLPPPIRMALESSLEVPLYPVRVHTDARTAAVVDGLGVRAFTYGLNIFLGSRERPTDLALMAHEVAHVVQQQGQPVLQTFQGSSAGDGFEREAQQTAGAVQRGERAAIHGRTGGAQAQGFWPVDEIVEWAEDRAWSLLNEYVPELVPILRNGPEGVFDWIKDKVTSAIEGLFNNFMAPVRAITGVGSWLSSHFAPLLAWMQDAAAKIAQNDCSPLREAAEKIEKIATSIITPIVEKLQAIATKVGDF